MSETWNLEKLMEVFDHLAPLVSDSVGGPVHLIRIKGPRWSYVAGFVPDELPFVRAEKIMLDEEWGILYYPEAGRKIEAEKVKALFLEGLEKHNDV